MRFTYNALDILYRRSLTFCAISDSILAIHGRVETTISIVSLIPAGNSWEISSETNCKHHGLQIVMHFTISPTSLQMLPIYVEESSCNVLSAQLGILRNSMKHRRIATVFNI